MASAATSFSEAAGCGSRSLFECVLGLCCFEDSDTSFDVVASGTGTTGVWYPLARCEPREDLGSDCTVGSGLARYMERKLLLVLSESFGTWKDGGGGMLNSFSFRWKAAVEVSSRKDSEEGAGRSSGKL